MAVGSRMCYTSGTQVRDMEVLNVQVIIEATKFKLVFEDATVGGATALKRKDKEADWFQFTLQDRFGKPIPFHPAGGINQLEKIFVRKEDIRRLAKSA